MKFYMKPGNKYVFIDNNRKKVITPICAVDVSPDTIIIEQGYLRKGVTWISIERADGTPYKDKDANELIENFFKKRKKKWVFLMGK